MDWADLIFILLAALLTIVAATLWQQRRLQLQQRHLDGLRWCGTLLELVLRMQQHRGMASALLAGDPGFRTGLAGKRREVEVLLLALQALPADSDASIRQVAEHELPELKLRWDQLCRELDGLTACNSMTRHSAIIGTLLAWLRGIGESCLNVRAMAGAGRLDFIVPVFVERLPALSEALGQIRALGSAVAAAGKLEPAQRVQLSFLIHRINELLGRSESALQHAGLQRNAEVERSFATVRERVQELLDMVCSDLLEPHRLKIAPAQYYATASQAIDAIFVLASLLRRRMHSDSIGAAADSRHDHRVGTPLVR